MQLNPSNQSWGRNGPNSSIILDCDDNDGGELRKWDLTQISRIRLLNKNSLCLFYGVNNISEYSVE
jgi:hypothetical protein